MKKAPDAFRTISEVSEILDTPAHVLRFWESKFYQVRPVKRAGGRRYYRPDDLALIAGIKHLLQDRGMTIRGVQKIMQEEGVRHVVGLGRNSGRMKLDDTAGTETPEPVEDIAPETPAEAPEPASPMPDPEPAQAQTQPEPETPEEAPEVTAAPEPAAPAPTAAVPTGAAPTAAARRPLPPPPVLDDEIGAEAPRLAQVLRRLPAGSASPASLAPVAQRLDRLLDRMAEASGTRRW
jgi:DNA-binding transcriptional MerR regulator